jgi:hypothetical protein
MEGENMALLVHRHLVRQALVRRTFVRRSILTKFLIVVSCMLPACVFTPPALAQHAASRIAGGGVHVSAPPISRPPISPVFHVPISAPRIYANPTAGIRSATSLRPIRRPVRPFPPVILIYAPSLSNGPFPGFNSCWWTICDLFWPWTFGYDTVSFYEPGPANYVAQASAIPVYVYGEERPDTPQLYLKDGTILNVSDYWLVDDQLHFTMLDEDNTKPVDRVIPFDELDLQKTVDVNTRRGFRFVLRNEPVEQYLRDHPDVTPPAVTVPDK